MSIYTQFLTKIYFALFLMFSASFSVYAGSVELKFSGNLTYEACALQPGDESINIDFGMPNIRDIYENTRLAGKDLILHLNNCDTSVANTVSLSFQGSESPGLPGFIAVSNSSGDMGIGIGIETSDGSLVAINSPEATSLAQYLSNGENVISLKAFIKGEPSSITNKSIQSGAFSQIITFHLDYN